MNTDLAARPKKNKDYYEKEHALTAMLTYGKFSPTQRKIIEIIKRLSIGCGRDRAYIKGYSFISKCLNEDTSYVYRSFNFLINNGVIIKHDKFVYSINWNFDEWVQDQPNEQATINLNELIHKNLSQSYIHNNNRISELRTMLYSEYLETPEWKEIRNKALKKSGFKCSVCNRDDELNVHHKTYKNRGCEKIDDLVVLCRNCHSIFHGKLEDGN